MDIDTLRQYRDILEEIEHCEEEKFRILTKLLSPKQSDGMPHASGVSDPVGRAGALLADLQIIIDNKLDELVAMRKDIEEAINCLPSKDRDILRLYYIEGYTLEKVAEIKDMSYRWIVELRNNALEKLKS